MRGGTPSELDVRTRKNVPLEHADAETMGRVGTIACVRNIAREDPGALDITVQDWTRRSLWLQPMELLQIVQPDFRRPAPVPLTMYPNQRIRVLHGFSLMFLDCTGQSLREQSG